MFSMIKRNNILIKNIYYMLSYAFRVLNEPTYKHIKGENFKDAQNLLAAILAKGITHQLKQGLHREYIAKCETLPVMRGKLNIEGTIRNRIQRQRLLTCDFDEFSENNVFNQILKTTAFLLLRENSVSEEYKIALKRAMLFLGNVDLIEPSSINWKRLRFQKNNESYEMLLNICYFIIEALLLTTEEGTYEMATFLDDHNMARLYERFILEYYRKHHPYLKPASRIVKWAVDDGVTDFLPMMKTDITLRYRGKVLIIDAKYFSETMQTHSQFSSQSHHSAHLYQIFAYIKNAAVQYGAEVAGMLLYAKTEEDVTPDVEYRLSGNKIMVKTLDLGVPFNFIANQLDDFVDEYFNLEMPHIKSG